LSNDPLYDRDLPADKDAERAILGAILLKNEICYQAIELLRPEYFHVSQHRHIFNKMIKLIERGLPIDLITLGNELHATSEFEKVGGATYIASLIDGVPQTDTIEYYARIVKEKAMLRRIIAVNNNASNGVVGGEMDAQEALNYLERESDEIEKILHREDVNTDIRERVITADELISLKLPQSRWAVEEIIPEGVSILAGRPKLGKSYLGLNISLAVASGGYAFERVKVEQGAVLHLALEDGLRRFQRRLKEMWDCRLSLPELHIKTKWPRLDEGGAKALGEWLKVHSNARLVVIDTFKKVRPLPRRGVGIYDEDYDGIALLVELAQSHNVSILVIHHTNKKRDFEDPVDLVSGSTGLTGGADAVLVLKRERGRHDATLFITGRDVEERELALEVDTQMGTWKLLGEAEEYRMSEGRATILRILKASDAPLSPKEIARRIGKRDDAVRQQLRRMANDGQIRSDNGKYALACHSGHSRHSRHNSETYSDNVIGVEA
jgi:hypothetical protein